jgi:hypothetical protein
VLRWRHDLVDPRSPLEEVLNAAHGDVPYMPHNVDDDQNDAVEGAADNVRTGVDAVAPDMLLRIDANPQHKMRGGDTRERGRRGHHERDDYLKPRCMFNICAAEDRAYHHTRNHSGAHKAVQENDGQRMSISWGGRRAYKPHSIDGRHKAEAQPFNCKKMTVPKM